MERKLFIENFISIDIRHKYRENHLIAKDIKGFAKEKVIETYIGRLHEYDFGKVELEFEHIFDFMNRKIFTHVNREMLHLITTLVDNPNFKLIPMVFSEKIVKDNYINSKSIRVYCSIIANMLYEKESMLGFEPIRTAISHIMQVILHIYTAYEIEQNSKSLPF